MNIEDKFTEIMARFKIDAGRMVEDAVTDIECGLLPYVADDTESNVNSRTENAIKKIICGDFEVSQDGWLKCQDDNGMHIYFKAGSTDMHSRLISAIVAKMPECPKDLRIKQLEDEVKLLNETRWGLMA
jgi:hypothetical protein